MPDESLKNKVIFLREKGKTYSEIRNILKITISKSTISYWCRDVQLSTNLQNRIKGLILGNIGKARKKALIVNKRKRRDYLRSLYKKNLYIKRFLNNKGIKKVILAALYMCEGSKSQKGSLMFGNSSPEIISLFLKSLRSSYGIDEKKFRCTVQCRADQDVVGLEKFWAGITKIPPEQFYKTRIDKRSFGKPSRKRDYKGVCRIDYFSAELSLELREINKIIYKGL